MGQLISFTDRLAERRREGSIRRPVAFFVTLDCPVAYLLAERIERDFGSVAWVPVLSPIDPLRIDARLELARRWASTDRLALVEPEVLPLDPRPVSRAAATAVAAGQGPGFILAALRLAFVGGFDLSEPDLIAEAAAASGVNVDAALAAARTPELDADLEVAAQVLRRRGIVEGPGLRIGQSWFAGLEALHRTAAFEAAEASLRSGYGVDLA